MKASVEASGLSLDDTKKIAKIDFSGDMHAGSKAWKTVWSAGQGVGAVKDPETIKEIIDTIKKSMYQLLSSNLWEVTICRDFLMLSV